MCVCVCVRLNCKALYGLHSSPDSTRVVTPSRMKCVRACSMHGRDDKCILLKRDMHKWEDCIQIDIRDVRCYYESGFTWLRIGTFGWLL